MMVPEKSIPEKAEAAPAKKKSERAGSAQSQELSLPPLSEIRSSEEILGEKSSLPSSPVSNSSNMALQLLKSKKKPAEEQPEEKTGVKKLLDENKNAVDYFKYNAKIILPSAAAVLLVCYGLYALMSSFVKTVDHPPLAIVTGIVTLDGQPLPHAVVTFTPQEEWKPDETPADSVGVTDEEGKFELSYAEDLKGAALGEHKVRILSTERNLLKSELKYTVKDESNNAEFKLLSNQP